MSQETNTLAVWRAIETAPKDSFVIVAGPSGYVTTPLRVDVARWSEDYKAWLTHSHDRFTDSGADATHWMPLPEFPVNQQ